jgi:hypothetical protein
LFSFHGIVADKGGRGRNGQEAMRIRRGFAVIGLLLALSAAGCADTGAASDNDKRGVFYGGVSAGGTRP